MKTTVLILSLALTVATAATIHAQSNAKPTPETATTKLGSITGRVLSDGQAVPNASVTVTRLSEAAPFRYVPTSDNGEFEAKGLDNGIYRITVAAPGYVSALTASEQETYYRVGDSVTLMMQKGGVITGRVLDAEDQPVVAVRVRAIRIRDENGKPALTGETNLDRVTDDRGIYRIFGLRPGTYVISAGGRGSSGYGINGYDHDAPVYAPGSTRDAAAEILIGSGEEKTIDVHYHSEAGHAVAGKVAAPINLNLPWISIYLARLVAGAPDVKMSESQNASGKGFEFLGVADGEYLIWAQYSTAAGETLSSEPRRITIKGADVTGIELSAKPLATVAGEIVLVPSNVEACQGKRQPSFDETVVALRRTRPLSKDVLESPSFGSARATANDSGKFVARNLGPGQYELDVRFFGRHWFLQSIAQRASAAAKENQSNDLARNALTVKSGDAVSGVKVTLAAGGATFSGQVEAHENQPLPARLSVYLVPSEKEKSDDVLRYFSTQVEADGSFAFEQIPPGHYWALLKTTSAADELSVRSMGAVEFRAKLRREAEAEKSELELKPCQSVIGYKLLMR